MTGSFKMKNSALRANAKYKTPIQYSSPVKKETEAEFLARMKKEGTPIKPDVDVKASEHQTQRDVLAKQYRTGLSGIVKPGMEQSVRSKSYREADKYIAKQAAERDKESPAKQGLILESKKRRKQREKSPLGPKTVNIKDIKGLKPSTNPTPPKTTDMKKEKSKKKHKPGTPSNSRELMEEMSKNI